MEEPPGHDLLTHDEPSPAELTVLLNNLRVEHRRIDSEIKDLIANGVSDMLAVSRMKKVKLSLKDKIAHIESRLTPDIIA